MTRENARKPMRIPIARLIVCLVASGLAASCATSGSTPGSKLSVIDQSFLRGISSYDQNRDGVVTCDEWRTAAASAFTKANKSGSGFLTEEEFRNLAASDRIFLVATFKYYDANGDGKVDRKEFVERPNPAFTHADKDTDCRLTEPELLTARNLVAPPVADASPRRSAIGTGAPPGAGGGY
jgi:Ca2+-binding EF-hand superfamily protein